MVSNLGLKVVIIIYTITVLIPALGLGIASFVIAEDNKYATCDKSFMDLSVWLNVNGALNIVFSIIILLLLILTFRAILAGVIGLVVLYYIHLFFTVAWNIVGAIILFRDSMSCLDQTPALWIMTLICLIFQWISIVTYICNLCSRSRQNN